MIFFWNNLINNLFIKYVCIFASFVYVILNILIFTMSDLKIRDILNYIELCLTLISLFYINWQF